MNNSPYTYTNYGRNRRTFITVLSIYFALLAAIILVDAAWWLMGFLALFTLPALWDLYANPSAGIVLTDTELKWFSGKRHAEIPLHEIDHMRFDIRLDFSVRMSVVLAGKQRIRLPYESLPQHQEFEDALKRRGVKTERHQFALM